jgi:L-iditol 2-dehydrogenase
VPSGTGPDRAPSPGRAVRLHGRRDLRLHDEPAPTAGPGEVTVRVTAVGLCGSDLHWYEDASIGETGLGTPLVLGHELAGVIEGGSRDGERVAIDPADPCDACTSCRAGRRRLCAAMRFAGQPPADGGLRTRMAWPSSRCVPIPASIPDDQAPLLEVLGIAIHALDLAGIAIDEASPASAVAPVAGVRAGVYGSGPIGLVLIRALRAAAVREIVATDLLPHRADAARASGATRASLVDVNATDPAAEMRVDVAFECAGTDEALDTAVRAVAPGGRVLLLGIPAGDRTAFPASVARRKELALQLVRRMEASDLGRAVALVAAGRVSLDGLVSHRFPLEDAPTAFLQLARRAGLKIVVEPQRSG